MNNRFLFVINRHLGQLDKQNSKKHSTNMFTSVENTFLLLFILKFNLLTDWLISVPENKLLLSAAAQ